MQLNKNTNTQSATDERDASRQRKHDAIERARRMVAQFDAGERDRMRRDEAAKRKKVTAARLTLAALVEGAMIENPAFAEQMRRRAMRLLSPDEFALVAAHLDALEAEYRQRPHQNAKTA